MTNKFIALALSLIVLALSLIALAYSLNLLILADFDQNNDYKIRQKIISYEKIQKVFSKFIFLIHHDRFCKLFANVNVLHKRDFNVTIFHVKKNKNDFIKVDIEFIFFFNKILIFAKFKY